MTRARYESAMERAGGSDRSILRDNNFERIAKAVSAVLRHPDPQIAQLQRSRVSAEIATNVENLCHRYRELEAQVARLVQLGNELARHRDGCESSDRLAEEWQAAVRGE